MWVRIVYNHFRNFVFLKTNMTTFSILMITKFHDAKPVLQINICQVTVVVSSILHLSWAFAIYAGHTLLKKLHHHEILFELEIFYCYFSHFLKFHKITRFAKYEFDISRKYFQKCKVFEKSISTSKQSYYFTPIYSEK